VCACGTCAVHVHVVDIESYPMFISLSSPFRRSILTDVRTGIRNTAQEWKNRTLDDHERFDV